MDPNDWQRYRKRGPQSRSGGMDLGIGGSSGSGNLGIADYLTANFDNLGGGELSPQQQLMETQKAIREGGAMKSPETDVTRFITEAPDGSNYMDPKPAEIPPMLARQITDPTPPAPAKGSGIDPNMLVRSQGDAQSRGSNLANPMPRREDFRQNESMAAKLEERANKAMSGGWMSFAPDHTTASATRQLELANALRGRDEAKYQASLNQYFIQRPDQYNEWVRMREISGGKPAQHQPTIATQRGTQNIVSVDSLGRPHVIPGVRETQLDSNEMIADRAAKAAVLRAEQDRLERESREKLGGLSLEETKLRVAAQDRATGVRQGGLDLKKGGGGKKRATTQMINTALRAGRVGSEKFEDVMYALGNYPQINEATGEKEWWTPDDSAAAQPGAAPATGGKAPADPGVVEWKKGANGKPAPATGR